MGINRYQRKFVVLSFAFLTSLQASIAASPPVATLPLTGAATQPTPQIKNSAAKAESKPFWSDLSASQKNALAPLAADWPKIDPIRKKKWLEIGNRFATMRPEEQQRIQEKMRTWAKLTPDERRVAREVYSRTKRLDADQKSAQWQEYQQLPDEEKKRLAADIAAKKHVVNLPSGAASSNRRKEVKLAVPVIPKAAGSADTSPVFPAPSAAAASDNAVNGASIPVPAATVTPTR